jgi:predicted acetyltransferase
VESSRITLDDWDIVKNEVNELFYKHWDDVALNKDKIKLNPDWDFYDLVNKAGYLLVYTVRVGAKLVGYSIVVAKSHPHYKDHTFAASDIIFIDKDHRKGLVGYNLIKFASEDLRSKGVSVFAISTKVHKPFDSLLNRLKFNLIERVSSKYLGE